MPRSRRVPAGLFTLRVPASTRPCWLESPASRVLPSGVVRCEVSAWLDLHSSPGLELTSLPCPQVLVPLCPQPTVHHSARAPTLDLRGARCRTATSTHHRLILLVVHRRHEHSRRLQTPSTTRSLLTSSRPQVVSSRDSGLGRRSRPSPSTRLLFSDLPHFGLFLWTRLWSDLLPAAPEDRPSASTNLDPGSGRRLRLDGSVDRVVLGCPLSFSLLITVPLSLPCFSCFLVIVAHLHRLICVLLLFIVCLVQCTRSTDLEQNAFKREEEHSERKQSNKRRREVDVSLHDFRILSPESREL